MRVEKNENDFKKGKVFNETEYSAHFGSTYTKIGTIQRRLAWPLCKDDMQIHEVVHVFFKKNVSSKKCVTFVYTVEYLFNDVKMCFILYVAFV